MQIAILSDTHSRLATVSQALHKVRERDITTILHCGDIEDSSAVQLFAGFDAHFVFGNCDHCKDELRTAMTEAGVRLHGAWGQLELEGVKIAFLHGDDPHLMRDVENSGHFDFLFYGHTHQAKEHLTGNTRVINPGALHRANPRSFLILDLPTGRTEPVVVE